MKEGNKNIVKGANEETNSKLSLYNTNEGNVTKRSSEVLLMHANVDSIKNYSNKQSCNEKYFNHNTDGFNNIRNRERSSNSKAFRFSVVGDMLHVKKKIRE